MQSEEGEHAGHSTEAQRSSDTAQGSARPSLTPAPHSARNALPGERWAQDPKPGLEYPPPHYERTDFTINGRYPSDRYGEEVAPDARVWRIYRDECTKRDDHTIITWNDTLDVLLIFAGLFSAVSTAFIIESYQTLQPDYTEYTARLLFTLVTAQNGSGAFVLPPASAFRSPDVVIKSANSLWVNGLWFTSLVLALAVALYCILLKQYIASYMTILAAPSPNAREWACRRTLYHGGLVRWGVPTYISVLPVLLHASLFSFAVGLVLFLWPLDAAVAYVVLSLTAFLLTAYLAYALFPLWYDDCPTQTVTQVQDLRRLGSFIAMPFHYVFSILVDLPDVLRLRLSAWRQGIIIRKNGMTSRIRNLCHRFQELATYGLRHRAGGERCEPPLADASPSRRLDWEALKWLMIYSASDDVHGVTVQAMGSYICEQPGWRPSLKLRSGAQVLDRQLIQGINDCLYDRMTRLSSQKLGSEAAAIEYGRYARACLAMYKTDVWRMDWRVRRALSVFRAAKVPHILDLPVLHTLALLLHAEGDRSGPSMDSLLLSMQAQISQSMALDRDTASSHFAALQALQLMRRMYLSGAAGSPSSMAVLCHAARLERLSYGDMWPVALYVTTTLGSTALQPPSKSDTSSARTRTILIELWSCILASGKLTDREATIAHEHLADSAHMLLREVGFRTMLDRFPHFVNLLDSPAFLQHRWKADGATGRGAVWSAGAGARWSFDRIGPVADLALSIMRTTEAVPRERIPRLCARILRVASLSADAAPSDDVEAAQSVRDIMMRRLRDVVFGYRLLETHQSHPADMSRGRVADTEETLLSFLVSDEPTGADADSNQGRSAWTCLLQVRGDHLVGIISVADVLAAELCRAQRRGGGAVITDLTTTFFDGLTPLLFNVWRIWQSRDLISPAEVMQGRREIMRRIAQHCLELRPSWRTEECAAYFKECDDASAQYLYALFEEVDVTVSRCSICA